MKRRDDAVRISIEDIEIAAQDFTPKKRGVYALLCKGAHVFGAIEWAHRFARSIGFEDAAIITEHFFYQRDCQLGVLREQLEKLSISGWAGSGAMIVIPGLTKKLFDWEHRADEAELAAFLFSLRSQLDGLEYPVFVPFPSEGLAVDEKLLWTGLATMGFTRVELNIEADKSIGSMLLEDALDEAASMAVFPDTLDWLMDEGDE